MKTIKLKNKTTGKTITLKKKENPRKTRGSRYA